MPIVIVAPDIIGAQVLSVVRGLLMRGHIDEEIATRSVDNLASAPVRRRTTEHLVRHVWSCRSNLTPYAPALGVQVRRPLTCP